MNFNDCTVHGIPAKHWNSFCIECNDPTIRLFYWKTSDGKYWVKKSYREHSEGCFWWTEEQPEEIKLEEFTRALVNGYIEKMLISRRNLL